MKSERECYGNEGMRSKETIRQGKLYLSSLYFVCL